MMRRPLIECLEPRLSYRQMPSAIFPVGRTKYLRDNTTLEGLCWVKPTSPLVDSAAYTRWCLVVMKGGCNNTNAANTSYTQDVWSA